MNAFQYEDSDSQKPLVVSQEVTPQGVMVTYSDGNTEMVQYDQAEGLSLFPNQ